MAEEEYKKILTDLIQRQMIALGPNIALDKARKVVGLSVSDDGRVKLVSGDPRMILKSVISEYAALSGQIAKIIWDALLEKYPEMKNLQEE